MYPYSPEVQKRFTDVEAYRNQDFKRGIEGYQAIIRDYPEDGAVLARAYYYLAETAAMLSDFEHCEEYCDLGIKYGKESGNTRCQILCIIKLSSIKISEYNEAMAAEYLYEALSLVEQYKENDLYDLIHVMLAQLFDSAEDYETAIYYYKLSMDDFIKKYPEGRLRYASIYGSRVLNVAACYISLGQKENLEKAYQELVDIRFGESIPVFAVLMDLLKGYIAYLNEDKESAITLFRKVLEDFKKEKDVMDAYVMLEKVYDVFESYGLISDQKQVVDLMQHYNQCIPSQMCSSLYTNLKIRYSRQQQDTEALLEAYEAYYTSEKNYHNNSSRQKQEYIKLRKRLFEEDMENKKELNALKEISTIDALTGLENRHSLFEYTNRVFPEAVALQQTFGVLLLDIDKFKEYNDTLGHIAGDNCLQKVARLFKSVYNGHFCARYGGDEFVCVFYGISQEHISALCTEFHKQVKELNLPHLENIPYKVVTVSQGVSVRIPTEKDDFVLFLQEADEGLYQCKKKGRSRTEFFQSETEELL